MKLLYLIVDHLYDGSLVLIPPIIKRLNSRSLWSSFGWSAMRKFSEGLALSIGPFQKVQLQVNISMLSEKMKSRQKLFKNCRIHSKNC